MASEAQRDPRRDLLAIQRRLFRRLKREIDATIAENPANVQIYQEEYERDLRRYQRVSSKAELVGACAQADIVYLGDYHTLPQAQKTLVKLLLALSRLDREVVLGMEMVHIKDQPHLDRYLTDMSPDGETEFLRAIDYRSTWDFHWPPYREVFEVAQRRGVRVVGINSDPSGHSQDHLLERDFQTSEIVVNEIKRNPKALIVIFDGDLHVARDHLPLLVDNLIQREGLRPRKHVIVHQNAEDIWWQLARERREGVNIVSLADDAFCVFNASPIEKLHSYLSWVSEQDVLEVPLVTSTWEFPDDLDGLGADEDDDESDRDEERAVEYTDQVHRLVTTVARFLGIERDDLSNFHLFTVNDLDFLNFVGDEDGAFTERELEDIKRQILSNESYFIPKGDVIYLADFSVVNAAEESTHFLHHRCSEYEWDKPRSLAVDFYFRILTEALGFFGSKVVVPTRECWRERDCELYVERHRAKERERRRKREEGAEPDPKDTAILEAVPEERIQILHNQRVTLRTSRLVLHHKKLERRYLEEGEWPGAGRCLTQPTEVHLLLTHMLGHMLGDKLYAGMLRGDIPKDLVRQLFYEPLERPGVGLARYLELVAKTRDVPHGLPRGERL
ncbi:MAG: ChaN family lipoprotein [Planctomycetes bacterium]|nr:ChaN family lipoprotein [Planctomycetota bacterium]